jgi:hypothetical protein
MPTTKAIYERVRKLVEEGRDVKSSCRSVAHQLQVRDELVEVTVAGENMRWYKELGFNVREKI